MKEKKQKLDKMIKRGFRLEYPYFWYLENCTMQDLDMLFKYKKKFIDK